MMNNKKDMNSQFNRMKQLMNFGLNESKKQPYTGIEYSKVAADGKLYGIVREGTKYFIKVSPKKENALVENFEYIGGFRNRKDNEYSSFANAQKNFDFKLRSLAEAYGNGKNIVIESWNPDRQEELTVEATEKMRKEISRERQIMENVMQIANRKSQTIKPINEGKDCGNDPYCEKADKEFDVKDNIKGKPEKGGKAEDANDHEKVDLKKTEIKESEVLGWNRNDDYMDKTHGTEIGDSMPFDDAKGKDIDDAEGTSTTGKLEKGTVEEGKSAIESEDNQNSPNPGVGDVGDDNPFNGGKGKQIDEAIDDLDDGADLEDDTDDTDLDLDGGYDDTDLDSDDETDLDGGYDDTDLDSDEEEFEDDSIEERLSALESTLDKIAEKLGVGTYDDDSLYDDDEFEDNNEDFEGEDDEFEGDNDEFEGDDDDDFEGEDDELEGPLEDEVVYETKAYRAMKLREARNRRLNESGMESFTDNGRVPQGNMNKLDDFGKHPAYQKVVMSLPDSDMQEFPDYYDMNDDSVKNTNPYGEKIGDGAPFEVDVDSIENAISESIMRYLKKKK